MEIIIVKLSIIFVFSITIITMYHQRYISTSSMIIEGQTHRFHRTLGSHRFRSPLREKNSKADAGLLHACVSYPLVLDVLELVGQLQLELLEVTSQEEERAGAVGVAAATWILIFGMIFLFCTWETLNEKIIYDRAQQVWALARFHLDSKRPTFRNFGTFEYSTNPRRAWRESKLEFFKPLAMKNLEIPGWICNRYHLDISRRVVGVNLDGVFLLGQFFFPSQASVHVVGIEQNTKNAANSSWKTDLSWRRSYWNERLQTGAQRSDAAHCCICPLAFFF